MILDTEFFISLDEDDPDAEQLATELEASGVPLRVPTVVIHELYISVGLGSSPTLNVRTNEALVANKPIVDLDANIARRAGILEGTHRASDSKSTLGAVDAIIASTGLVYNEPVVTNDGDFQDVESLQVELY